MHQDEGICSHQPANLQQGGSLKGMWSSMTANQRIA